MILSVLFVNELSPKQVKTPVSIEESGEGTTRVPVRIKYLASAEKNDYTDVTNIQWNLSLRPP